VRICVFCGSSAGRGERYLTVARELGATLARRGIGLVYGGARVGTMGAVADAVLAAGGEVTGVIPAGVLQREVAHTGLTDLRVVADLHERKALMSELADGYLALPGGAGTLEELFEVWTWAQLGLHGKPIGLVDVDGFYQPLLAMVGHLVTEEFLRPEYAAMVHTDPDPAVLLDRFAAHVPPAAKWAAAPAAPALPEDPVDVVAWVHVQDGRLLTVRTHGKERFYLPGGKREPGESDPAALLREVREELGVELDPSTLRCHDIVVDKADGFAAGRQVRMVCYTATHTGEFRPAREIAELRWSTPADTPHLAPATAQILHSALKT
jgi:uncharacterized protein (TIGR00730 family)